MSNEEVKVMKELAKKLRLACWESTCDDCPFRMTNDTKEECDYIFDEGRLKEIPEAINFFSFF